MSDTQAETSKEDEQITHPQPVDTQQQVNSKIQPQDRKVFILVPRGRAPFGQHQESRPLAWFNTGSPRFTDFPSLCACSESSLTNLIGSGLNLLCFQSHSKTECRWTGPEVAILGADQKEFGLWGREWKVFKTVSHLVSAQFTWSEEN